MLKMPALIREWKSVSSLRLHSPRSGVLLTIHSGRPQKLDQVAQIVAYNAIMGYHLLYTIPTNYKHKNNTSACLLVFSSLSICVWIQGLDPHTQMPI